MSSQGMTRALRAAIGKLTKLDDPAAIAAIEAEIERLIGLIEREEPETGAYLPSRTAS